MSWQSQLGNLNTVFVTVLATVPAAALAAAVVFSSTACASCSAAVSVVVRSVAGATPSEAMDVLVPLRRLLNFVTMQGYMARHLFPVKNVMGKKIEAPPLVRVTSRTSSESQSAQRLPTYMRRPKRLVYLLYIP